jgi:hypothetical protein
MTLTLAILLLLGLLITLGMRQLRSRVEGPDYQASDR